MTPKFRRELTPNITFQPNKIFVRHGLFGKIIKSCKATNVKEIENEDENENENENEKFKKMKHLKMLTLKN